MTITDLSAPGEARDALASGAEAFRRRDFAGAALRFAAAAEAAPDEPAPRLALARALALAGRIPEARAACDEAARRNTADLRVWLLAARLAARADDGRARITHLRAAVALRPSAVALRLQLLAALQRRLQHRPALDLARELVALAPEEPATHLAEARCHLALNRLDEAEAALDRSGADGLLDAERARLRDDLALRRARTGAGPSAAATPPPRPGPTAPVSVAVAAPRPVLGGPAPAPASPSTPTSRGIAAPPFHPADVEGLVTAASLRAIDRARRRPRVTDHLLIIRALVLRDLRSRHRNSALGVLVELIRPAVVVFVHYWLFYILRRPMPGQIPIEVFVMAGFSTWFAFNGAWVGAATGGRWPAGATAWPGVTDLHLRAAKASWAVMLNLAFCLLGLVPLALIGRPLPFANVPQTCLIFAMAGLSGFGLGLLLERLGQRVTFVKTLDKLLTWALFITSGLYFSIATTPPLVARYYGYNPLLHLLEYERHAFDPGYPIALLDLRYPAAVTVGLLVTGLLIYRSLGCTEHD